MGHLLENGFQVEVHEIEDVLSLNAVKARGGVPAALAGCHTAFVDGYVVEGHVPADLVTRLLEERPNVLGLAVPGMPEGSPGMEGPHPESYDVLALTKDGGAYVYDRR